MVDLILKNGLIVDGTGAPAFPADLAIESQKIVAVGDVGSLSAAKTLDVNGLVISPGFIDTHVHTDAALLNGSVRTQRRGRIASFLIC